jgi:hypothetical protein
VKIAVLPLRPVNTAMPLRVATTSPGCNVGSAATRQPELIAAVAGAAGRHGPAIGISDVEGGIAAAVTCTGVVDGAAGIEAGLARRPEGVAGFGRAHVGMRPNREVIAVADAHTEGLGRAEFEMLRLD